MDGGHSPVGRVVAIERSLHAFVPHPAPRSLNLDNRLVKLVTEASQRAATLGGIGEMLPDPDLLMYPFLSREAVLSSRIEGTQTLMTDLFLYEGSDTRQDPHGDAGEVANYVHALRDGIAALARLPLSVRLFNEVHARLLEDVRGEDKRPGELRDKQVFVGPKGAPPEEAFFIPPPAALVRDLLSDLEAFVNEDVDMPVLVQCAVMHYQFETIHPYLDGNGRLGRLLITLFLHARGLVPQPLLYLSAYLEKHRDEYYYQLNRLREAGDWAAWIEFFMVGVVEQADDAIARSRTVLRLHAGYTEALRKGRASANTHGLLNLLFRNPIVTASFAARSLGVTDKGIRGNLNWLVAAGIVDVIQGWPAVYSATELLRAIED